MLWFVLCLPVGLITYVDISVLFFQMYVAVLACCAYTVKVFQVLLDAADAMQPCGSVTHMTYYCMSIDAFCQAAVYIAD